MEELRRQVDAVAVGDAEHRYALRDVTEGVEAGVAGPRHVQGVGQQHTDCWRFGSEGELISG